jgi:glycerol transport system ATP-binding protein
MASITLDNLAHSYLPNPQTDADYALKEMNHDWVDGEAYALLGSSGCGKTTLLNIISGLLQPSQGSYSSTARMSPMRSTEERNIAQVFQFPVVYDTMTVRENLAFPAAQPRSRCRPISPSACKTIENDRHGRGAGRKARGLTADAKQKISLGRGMVREDVNALLFDEPLTVIDPHMKWELRTQAEGPCTEFGHTMIYVTHDQTEALTFADKVVVMYEGAWCRSARPKSCSTSPSTPLSAISSARPA